MTDSKTNQPVDRIKLGPVTASIWRNGNDTGQWYSITVERTYKDEATGDWKPTKSYGQSDLLYLAKVAHAAYDRVRELRESDKAAAANTA